MRVLNGNHPFARRRIRPGSVSGGRRQRPAAQLASGRRCHIPPRGPPRAIGASGDLATCHAMGTSPSPVPLGRIGREWARLGMTGFGGPPAHIQLLRALCVDRNGWLAATEFEDAVAACNLLPGPASTQLAIYCARRAGGWRGALVGGLGFIVPGLVVILVLSALLLGPHPSRWVLGAAAAAGAVIPAVAVRAGLALMPASLLRARRATGLSWWVAAVVVGAVAAAIFGAWVAVALVGCGLIAL